MSELSSLSPTAYVLGAASLYLGFSGVMGLLIRYANQHRTPWAWLFGAGYVSLLFLPATAFVVQRSGWPALLRLGVFLLSIAVALLAVLQPVWAPRQLWRPKFGRRYFAAAMTLSAVWGLSLGISTSAIFPMLVGASAIAAAAAALTLRPNPS
jgi:hypothetical protein